MLPKIWRKVSLSSNIKCVWVTLYCNLYSCEDSLPQNIVRTRQDRQSMLSITSSGAAQSAPKTLLQIVKVGILKMFGSKGWVYIRT